MLRAFKLNKLQLPPQKTIILYNTCNKHEIFNVMTLDIKWTNKTNNIIVKVSPRNEKVEDFEWIYDTIRKLKEQTNNFFYIKLSSMSVNCTLKALKVSC